MAAEVRRPVKRQEVKKPEGGFLDKISGAIMGGVSPLAAVAATGDASAAIPGYSSVKGYEFGAKNPGTGEVGMGVASIAGAAAGGGPLMGISGGTQALGGYEKIKANQQVQPGAIGATPPIQQPQSAMGRRMSAQSSNNLQRLREAAFAIPDLPQEHRKQAAADILSAYQQASAGQYQSGRGRYS